MHIYVYVVSGSFHSVTAAFCIEASARSQVTPVESFVLCGEHEILEFDFIEDAFM